jgi:LacI family transcriptional regulator, fructose operon transcriptional repressor
MASIKDVAEKAGVSVATVSRVLANKPHVRPEIRDAVMRVVVEMDYRPSRIASSMRRQSSRVIGVMIGDIRNPFFTAITRAIEDAANLQDMNIFLCNTDENPDKEQAYVDTLLDERVAGLIVTPTVNPKPVFNAFIESGIPLVAIDRRIQGANIDCVLSDNRESAALLTNHLVENGYTKIGALFGLKNSFTGRERMEGYRRALEDHEIKYDPRFSAYTSPREDFGEALIDQWLTLPDHPQAILTGNSRLTIGALNAIQKAGYSIPEDIALCGFDETPWMRHAGTGISVISQPTYEMGKTAADLLFERIKHPDRPTREVILKGQLLVRNSTRRL